MTKTKISPELARNLALRAQRLDGSAMHTTDKPGIAQTIEQLGYVQIDTISIINRSHHHTLWTRHPGYHEGILHDLQAKYRAVFEYWGHAMSYLPLTDYRYYIPRMRNFENPRSPWAEYQMQKCRHLLQPVLERVRSEGPLSAKDFQSPDGKKGGTWWDWKPAKVALELLFWRGDLMIAERRGFQKAYDLTERVLPDHIDTTIPNVEEIAHFLVTRALKAFGVADERAIRKYLQPDSARDADLQVVNRDQLAMALHELVSAKRVVPVQLQNDATTVYYALNEVLENSHRPGSTSENVFFLSPFDNLVIQRERLKRIFGFDYALECYLPEKKRKYGYFVLPVLWGNRFVGRLDPKADRREKSFVVRNLILEPEAQNSDEFLTRFADSLARLARFNGCETVAFEKVTPTKIKTILKRLVRKALQGC